MSATFEWHMISFWERMKREDSRTKSEKTTERMIISTWDTQAFCDDDDDREWDVKPIDYEFQTTCQLLVGNQHTHSLMAKSSLSAIHTFDSLMMIWYTHSCNQEENHEWPSMRKWLPITDWQSFLQWMKELMNEWVTSWLPEGFDLVRRSQIVILRLIQWVSKVNEKSLIDLP